MPIDKVPVKKQKALKAEKPKKEDKLTLSERFARLGLVRDWDFVFHLPLRYEDETQITDCRALTPAPLPRSRAALLKSLPNAPRVLFPLPLSESRTRAGRLPCGFSGSVTKSFSRWEVSSVPTVK